MLLNKVAIPKEHGAWGFVLEPLILSLIVAFSVNGLLLALASFILFLANQPIKIIFTKSISTKHKSAATKILFFYSSIIFLLFVAIIVNAKIVYLLPYAFGLLVMLLFLFFQINNLGRYLFFEFIPSFGITLMAISIVLMNGSFQYNVWIFGILLLSRAIPTIIYVNAKVKEVKRKDYSKAATNLTNSISVLIIFLLGWNSLLPELSFLASIILLLRSEIGFSKLNFTKTVKQIGIAEFVYGSLFVVINGIVFLI
ncbi:MAG: YwiC-like family protein [Bacteroidetes bacterium]|nr:YwiC-like family protein [Bacteroidota bacterium]MBU1116585.1 YwiC-like family protein [Bacteroidota bacterium]MBU1797193.1 YwiC-like family protein [Bacteroidota bacterium]